MNNWLNWHLFFITLLYLNLLNFGRFWHDRLSELWHIRVDIRSIKCSNWLLLRLLLTMLSADHQSLQLLQHFLPVLKGHMSVS